MHFYVLENAPTGDNEQARTDAIAADDSRVGEAPRCELCGKFTGPLEWLPPFRVEIETWGKRFGDLAFFGGESDILVSERFKGLWDRAQLVGLAGFEPVEIARVKRYRKLKGDPPHYLRAQVLRGQTDVDYAASGFEFGEPPTCPACQLGVIMKRRAGIVIKPESWHGEDIFVPRGSGEILVAPRFKKFCEAYEIANAVFAPAETYARDFYPWEKNE